MVLGKDHYVWHCGKPAKAGQASHKLLGGSPWFDSNHKVVTGV